MQAADVLNAAFNDPEPTVRQAAVVAMVGQETAAASYFLRQALRDDAESVRLLAAELLRETGRRALRHGSGSPHAEAFALLSSMETDCC